MGWFISAPVWAKSWSIRIVLLVSGLLAIVALGGAAYQALAFREEVRRFPRPGRLVSAGGFRLNLYCTGQGSLTVLLEAGLADSLDSWRRVQPDIAIRSCLFL